MISVNVNKKNLSIETEGHADYAEKGSDIVCAAISALMWALICGLDDVCRSDKKFGPGNAFGKPYPEDNAQRIAAEAVFRGVLHGIDAVAQKYPNNVVIHYF